MCSSFYRFFLFTAAALFIFSVKNGSYGYLRAITTQSVITRRPLLLGQLALLPPGRPDPPVSNHIIERAGRAWRDESQ